RVLFRSMAEARKPRTREETLRVTTTVIDIEQLLDAVDHAGNEFLLPEQLGGAASHLALQVVGLALAQGAHRTECQGQGEVHAIQVGDVEREGVARILVNEPERRQGAYG